jgi:tyrosyl-tRNA synthetase
MTIFHSALMQTLYQRGFIHQTTPIEALDAALNAGPMTVYYGCDATASSLHVGNLLGLMVMRMIQDMGHRAVLLLGGGTTKIGDPSGRDSTRKLLTDAEINTNISGILSCYRRVLNPESMVVVNNADWLDSLGYTSFLREIGVHFSVNRLLNFDSVKNRLQREESLSFIEFNYILMQSYDYWKLYKHHGCALQIGGGDQWGNIVSGVDLIRRLEGVHVHGLTWPLLETSTGAKMGKTAQGAVWLDPALCSAYDYWQFWRNVDDRDVVRFLKLFTFLPLDVIEPFESITGSALNEAKILLANQATALIHGVHAVQELTSAHQTACAYPQYVLTPQDQDQGVLVYKILVSLGWVSSGREGRQKITEGAVKIDGMKISDPMATFTWDIHTACDSCRITCGGKKTALLVLG